MSTILQAACVLVGICFDRFGDVISLNLDGQTIHDNLCRSSKSGKA